MKQSDIITIILITMIGMVVSGYVANLILPNPDEASEEWNTVSVVEASVGTPDPEVFNPDAINPTIEVYVGNCEDKDQDGTLSQEEQIACGWVSSTKKTENTNDTDNSSSVLNPDDILKLRNNTTPSTPAATNTVEARDAKRKTDVDLFMTQLATFSSNNSGAIPAADGWTQFVSTYLTNNGSTKFADPSGVDYVVVDRGALTGTEVVAPGIANITAFDAKLYVFRNASCGETAGTVMFSNTKEQDVAVLLKYEGEGYYCSANH